jgi:hypothetical protein
VSGQCVGAAAAQVHYQKEEHQMQSDEKRQESPIWNDKKNEWETW